MDTHSSSLSSILSTPYTQLTSAYTTGTSTNDYTSAILESPFQFPSSTFSSTPITPRRSVSPSTALLTSPIMPVSINLSPSKGGYLPGPLSSSPRGARSSSRRISYTLKSRAQHYAYPLSIAALLSALFLLYTYQTSPHHFKIQSFTYSTHITYPAKHPTHFSSNDNGISLLEQDEEELLAEDDLFWESYEELETPALTDEEEAAEAEFESHRADVEVQNREYSLRALVWWLAEGGIIPTGWEVPSEAYLKRVGGRGMERLLESISAKEEGRAVGENGDKGTVFEEGWGEFAKNQYRTVVFSKSYCPYSKKAKGVLQNYRLTPSPFIVELDQRSDMAILQTLLQYFTSRRTVPNILLDFTSFGGSDEIVLAHAEGGLQRKFEEMELLPGFRRRKGLGKRRSGQIPPRAAVPARQPVIADHPIAGMPMAGDIPVPQSGEQAGLVIPGEIPAPVVVEAATFKDSIDGSDTLDSLDPVVPQPIYQTEAQPPIPQIPDESILAPADPIHQNNIQPPLVIPKILPPVDVEEPRIIIRAAQPEPQPERQSSPELIARRPPPVRQDTQKGKPIPGKVAKGGTHEYVHPARPLGVQKDGVAALIAAAKMRRPAGGRVLLV